MRKAFAIAAVIAFSAQPARPATDVQAEVPPGYSLVSPNAVLSFNLIVSGCDTIQAWANGTALGQLRYPYTVSFTTLPAGTNTVQVVYCNWNGLTQTNSSSMASSFRTFRGRLKR